MNRLLSGLLIAAVSLFISTVGALSQEMLISEYFNIQDVNSEWTELIVVKDNLNAVGWALTDANTGQVARQGGPKFNDIPLWRNLRAGTIIVLWHRLMPVTATLDTSAADGYLEMSSRDVRFFTTQYFAPPSDLADLNIADAGDVLQIIRADSSHVHALGHNKPTGPAYNAIPAPKANYDSGTVGAGRSCRVTGRTLSAYGVGLTKDSVVGAFNDSRGLPNRFDLARTNAGVPNINHWFWRSTREPQWTSTPTITLVSQTAKAHTIEWTPVDDTRPTDRTTGYVILRDTLGFTSFPANGIVDGTMISKGQRIGTAVVLDVRPVVDGGYRHIDSANLICGETYTYRVYGYRYSADDQLAKTDDTTARGRQYTETRFAQSGPIAKPNPAKPSIAASKLQVCVGDTVTLTTATVADRYDWTVDGVPVPVGGTTKIIVRQPGTYRLTITANGGCSSTSDPITITSLPAKDVEITPRGTQTICAGDSIVLTALTDASSYEWMRDGQILSGQTARTLTVRQSGDYIVRTASSTGCPGVSSVVRIRIQDVRVAFSASAIAFGKLGSCESSREQLVTLVNNGQVDVTIASTTFPPGFALRSPAPGFVVKAGQSQQVRITFAPPSSGTFSGTAVFTALPCSVAVPIPVSGERVESAASLDRALVDFGVFSACPTSIIKVDSTFQIINNGTQEILVQVPQVRPPFYLLTQFPAAKPLAPGASLPIQIQYRPLGGDLNQGVTQQIAFPFTSLTCSDTLRAQLQAASYQPSMRIDESSIDLGVLLSCQPEIDTIVTVTNSSLVPVTVNRIESKDPISMIGPAIIIPPSSSRTVPVRVIAPTTAGAVSYSGDVVGSPCDVRLTVQFDGLVIDPSYAPSTSNLNIGTLRSCSDSALAPSKVVVTAAGLSGLRSRVNTISVTGPFTTTVQSGVFFRDTLVIDISATQALAEGDNAGTLTFSLGPCNSEFTVQLSARKTVRRWSADLSSTQIGPIALGQTASSVLTIANIGSDSLTVSGVENIAAPFRWASPQPTFPIILPPAGSIQAAIEYTFTGYDRIDSIKPRIITSGLCADTITTSLRGITGPEGRISGVVLVAPINAQAVAGSTVSLPLALESMSALDRANLRSCTVYFSFDPAVVRPLRVQDGLNGETGTVTEQQPGKGVLQIQHSQAIVPTQQLVALTFQTYLAPVATTPVRFDSIRAGNVDITGRDGRISVLGSCIIAAELADIRNSVDVQVRSCTESSLTLTISTLTDEPSRVAVYATSGECVGVPLASQLPVGTYTLQLDVSTLASGSYVVVFEHGRHVRHRIVSLSR